MSLRATPRGPTEAAVLPAGTEIHPTNDFIVVRAEPLATTSAGGIVLSDQHGTRYEGTVVRCGPGQPGTVMYLKPGDKVLFLPHASIPISQGGETLLLLRQEAVFAVVGDLSTGRALCQPTPLLGVLRDAVDAGPTLADCAARGPHVIDYGSVPPRDQPARLDLTGKSCNEPTKKRATPPARAKGATDD